MGNKEHKFGNAAYQPFPYEEPKYAPSCEEREPGLFLGNCKPIFDIWFENFPSTCLSNYNQIYKNSQIVIDSLRTLLLSKKISDKEFNTKSTIIVDEVAHARAEGMFTISFQFNKGDELNNNEGDVLSIISDNSATLKNTPLVIPSFTGKYIAKDYLFDVSSFNNVARNDEEGLFVDKTQNWKIDNPIGKQYVTRVLLGKLIPLNADD